MQGSCMKFSRQNYFEKAKLNRQWLTHTQISKTKACTAARTTLRGVSVHLLSMTRKTTHLFISARQELGAQKHVKSLWWSRSLMSVECPESAKQSERHFVCIAAWFPGKKGKTELSYQNTKKLGFVQIKQRTRKWQKSNKMIMELVGCATAAGPKLFVN